MCTCNGRRSTCIPGRVRCDAGLLLSHCLARRGKQGKCLREHAMFRASRWAALGPGAAPCGCHMHVRPRWGVLLAFARLEAGLSSTTECGWWRHELLSRRWRPPLVALASPSCAPTCRQRLLALRGERTMPCSRARHEAVGDNCCSSVLSTLLRHIICIPTAFLAAGLARVHRCAACHRFFGCLESAGRGAAVSCAAVDVPCRCAGQRA